MACLGGVMACSVAPENGPVPPCPSPRVEVVDDIYGLVAETPASQAKHYRLLERLSEFERYCEALEK